jgi:hypothetical protein
VLLVQLNARAPWETDEGDGLGWWTLSFCEPSSWDRELRRYSAGPLPQGGLHGVGRNLSGWSPSSGWGPWPVVGAHVLSDTTLKLASVAMKGVSVAVVTRKLGRAEATNCGRDSGEATGSLRFCVAREKH